MSKPKDEKPDPIAEGLMERRTVVLRDEINHDSISELRGRLLTLQMRSTDRINLIIDSGGGNFYSALELCDVMTNLLTAPIVGLHSGPVVQLPRL